MRTIEEHKAAVSPIAPWLGGKRMLAKRICSIIDNDRDHSTYAEPFVGMGGIFLRRKRPAKSEFINDKTQDVHNLFRILQEHYVPFVEYMKWKITTQAEFERLNQMDPALMTDIQRAARFIYLQRLCFGGKVSGRSFGIATERPARFDFTQLQPMLEDLHARLTGVTVMNMDWSAFIDRIDRKSVLFYLDPPYFGHENDYGKDLFGRDQFEKMADQLSRLKGRFILSLNDRPEVREIFSAFEVQAVKTTYTAGSHTGQGKKVGELLISNWKLPKA